jgi:hypothetical protein
MIEAPNEAHLELKETRTDYNIQLCKTQQKLGCGQYSWPYVHRKTQSAHKKKQNYNTPSPDSMFNARVIPVG